MKKQKSTEALPPKSYDIFDRKEDIYRYHFHCEAAADMRYPLCPIVLSDLTRWDGNWIKHVDYQKIAVEMVLEGSINYSSGSRETTVSAGEIFLIIPHSNVKIVNANPGQARRKLALLISGNSPELLCHTLGFTEDVRLQVEKPSEIERIMRKIGSLLQKKELGKASDCTYSLLRRLAEEKWRGGGLEKAAGLRELICFISTHLSSPLTVKDMAAFQKCSVSTLQRQFKKFYAVTPQIFLCNLRLGHAGTLLSTTGVPVKEIAFRCGFSSALYFGQAFRKKFRCSPSEFRKKALRP